MHIGGTDVRKRVVVVAEIGNNHEGSFDRAQEMVGRAAEAGADAVKFQTFIPELLVSNADAGRLQRLRSFRLTLPQFELLARHAHDAGVTFLSTPFDVESAKGLNRFQSVFKIASGDNNFSALLDAVAAFGKPMIVSTGLADVSLLDRLHARVHDIWAQAGVSPGLALLHCVAAYPVAPEQANLGAIPTLKARFPDAVIGYSDHTIGTAAATCAVAAGARIVEKHFTLDRAQSDFRDHQLSSDPSEFRRLVDSIREVELMLGTGDASAQPCEAESQTAARRSIAAATNLPAGTRITDAHLTWLRPGTGLAPGTEATILGRTLIRSLQQGEFISPGDLI